MKPIALLIATGLSAALLAGCASNISRVETLSRYDRLTQNDDGLVPVRAFADRDGAGVITAVYMERAAVAPGVLEASGLDATSFNRLVDTLSGTMCRRLARGNMRVTTDPAEASHRLDLTITGFDATNPVAAGASGVIGVFVPGPLSPRIPIGIGALAAEGELMDLDGEQIVAMQYDARNHLASGAGTFTLLRGDIGATSDARDLAQAFADRFGDLIIEARDDANGQTGSTDRGTCGALGDDETGTASVE